VSATTTVRSHVRRKAGSDWRVLARGPKGTDLDVRSEQHRGLVFDELVIDAWFHLEQMDSRQWWMRIGDLHVTVNLKGDGSVEVVPYLDRKGAVPMTFDLPSADGPWWRGEARRG
jgi:hypothetical protein